VGGSSDVFSGQNSGRFNPWPSHLVSNGVPSSSRGFGGPRFAGDDLDITGFGDSQSVAATPVVARGFGGRSVRTPGWDRALAPAMKEAAENTFGMTSSQMILDDRLHRLQHSPVQFSRKQAQLSFAEQEIWAEKLAARAAELGTLDEIVEGLMSAEIE
jgi:hypothetical protein